MISLLNYLYSFVDAVMHMLRHTNPALITASSLGGLQLCTCKTAALRDPLNMVKSDCC